MTGIDVDGPRPSVEWVTSLPMEWRVGESERLVLMCLACDAFKAESAPGYEAISEWTGMQRTSCIRILARLCEETEHRPALLERVSFKGRRRTIWRLRVDVEPVVDVDRFKAPERRAQPSPNRSVASTGCEAEPVGGVDRFGDGSNRSVTSTSSGPEPSPNRRPTVAQPSPNRSTTSTTPFALSPNPQTPNPKDSAAADADGAASPADDADGVLPGMPPVEDKTPPRNRKSPHHDSAKAACDRWWNSLDPKPLGKDAYRNTLLIAVAALENGWDGEALAEALVASGQSVTNGSLNFHQARNAARNGTRRVADGYRSHWNDPTADFYGTRKTP